MSLCGQSMLWMALMGLVLVVGVTVVVSIAYCSGAGRWCDRRKPERPGAASESGRRRRTDDAS